MMKRAERWGRGRAAALLPGSASRWEGPPPQSPSRILVIRTDSRLGNLMLMEPLLRSLRERFPDSSMEILASHVFSDLLRYQGYSVIEVDKKGQIREPSRFLKLVRELREKRFDVALDAAHPHSFSLSGAVSAILSGAPCRISTDAGDSPGWYSLTVPEPPVEWHESRALHALGSLWDGWPEWSPPRLDPSGAPERDSVGLHVGAGGGKEYPPEMMEDLVGRICGRTMIEVYWGTERERTAALKLGEKYPVAVMPRLSLRRLIDRLAGLRLFVTADNGPMHVASALSVPVIALFRVDNAHRFAPLSAGSQILVHRDGPDPAAVAERVLRTLGCY
ncbi:MAG: glycosyltransferase family 9 protein [Candidatus Fermentibacteraceae bacterium]|nr:glycosyltransferase family 9 protein [Candidatus Fermentibacteraceae bacterium]